MQFTTTLSFLAAAFALGVQSAPVANPQTENPLSGEATGLAKRTNECGNSSFENETSGGSPLIGDCLQLTNNLSGNGNWLLANLGQERQLASYGTCKFIAQAPFVHAIHVGDRDVQDLIRDSVNKFGRDGRIGARGLMTCSEGANNEGLVWWWIRHT
jgi:hypothetical protein